LNTKLSQGRKEKFQSEFQSEINHTWLDPNNGLGRSAVQFHDIDEIKEKNTQLRTELVD